MRSMHIPVVQVSKWGLNLQELSDSWLNLSFRLHPLIFYENLPSPEPAYLNFGVGQRGPAIISIITSSALTLPGSFIDLFFSWLQSAWMWKCLQYRWKLETFISYLVYNIEIFKLFVLQRGISLSHSERTSFHLSTPNKFDPPPLHPICFCLFICLG